ncbi:hypothetical protein LOZ61_001895 [Ophidiomyces ophidiicola]|uniref:Uncharacterized protein n=1 Tax=Ophidiomyces ophidiicola TaxID=1387563 RepID=A0ACB8V3X0_9EURO|nr:hypothetical protein LOZ61_001895 [Ophidiomyces ophidiicola]KAI1923346.1 hypothetical protein LOZ64_001022 [Ophidiomyces ophidiicola]KAI1965059.1 hypothetical protein LOZ59_001384 [Ophidiomyces ophidiicola]KAI1974331.1 hypothetical protein LOZ56_001334 [Ophidiomyces ophidiicola]KAI2022212.1 hypothetical protein LOZ46_002021 [Ophidiomyces ophidiicola]
MIRNLRLPYVQSVGYAPLRCTWVPGCPAELHPLDPSPDGVPARVAAERAYKSAFKALLPDMSVPGSVGATCSSQFAVTRERVRARRRSDYERMRRWLARTNLEDAISGRVMEYTWHIIMGMPPVYCPPAGECYCITFGTAGRIEVEGTMDGQCQAGMIDPLGTLLLQSIRAFWEEDLFPTEKATLRSQLPTIALLMDDCSRFEHYIASAGWRTSRVLQDDETHIV